MKNFVLLAAVLLCFSCKDKIAEPPVEVDAVFFENPQPINDSELKSIPFKFIGSYRNEDSLILRIEKNLILTESYFKSRIHYNYLDTIKDSVEYKNGRLRILSTNEIYNVKKVGDSLELIQKENDTIFSFSDLQKAKRFDGKLVLNNKVDNLWKVKIITLKKNNLKIDYFTLDDLILIDSITKIKSIKVDSINHILKPSRSEFKLILRLKKKIFETSFTKIA